MNPKSETAEKLYAATLEKTDSRLPGLLERVSRLQLEHIRLFPDTLTQLRNGHFEMMAECVHCGRKSKKYLDRLERGIMVRCVCVARNSYHDPRAYTLRTRFGAMRQRCEKDSHRNSTDYKGRGIKVLFTSVREFVTWALEKWPNSDFIGLEFDRINNNGHYSKENLRLVPKSINQLNTKSTKPINIGTARAFLKQHPEIRMTATTTMLMLRGHLSLYQILERQRRASSRAGRRKPDAKTVKHR